mgnify:CR=1 FL=1
MYCYKIVKLADEDNENDEYHEPVGLVDMWMSYKALADAGWTQELIAQAKGVARSFVAMRLQLASFPADVLQLFVKNDFLKEGHALEIAKLSIFDNLAPFLTREAAMLWGIENARLVGPGAKLSRGGSQSIPRASPITALDLSGRVPILPV